MTTLSLLQDAASTTGFREFIQYVANGAAVGAFLFAWRTNTEVTRIKTVLMEPKTGNVDRTEANSTTIQQHAVQIGEHEVRLDGHDREIRRLWDTGERPRTDMRDVGALDRRSKA